MSHLWIMSLAEFVVAALLLCTSLLISICNCQPIPNFPFNPFPAWLTVPARIAGYPLYMPQAPVYAAGSSSDYVNAWTDYRWSNFYQQLLVDEPANDTLYNNFQAFLAGKWTMPPPTATTAAPAVKALLSGVAGSVGSSSSSSKAILGFEKILTTETGQLSTFGGGGQSATISPVAAAVNAMPGGKILSAAPGITSFSGNEPSVRFVPTLAPRPRSKTSTTATTTGTGTLSETTTSGNASGEVLNAFADNNATVSDNSSVVVSFLSVDEATSLAPTNRPVRNFDELVQKTVADSSLKETLLLDSVSKHNIHNKNMLTLPPMRFGPPPKVEKPKVQSSRVFSQENVTSKHPDSSTEKGWFTLSPDDEIFEDLTTTTTKPSGKKSAVLWNLFQVTISQTSVNPSTRTPHFKPSSTTVTFEEDEENDKEDDSYNAESTVNPALKKLPTTDLNGEGKSALMLAVKRGVCVPGDEKSKAGICIDRGTAEKSCQGTVVKKAKYCSPQTVCCIPI